MKRKKPTAPTGLSRTAAAWFRKMVSEFDFADDPGGLALLENAAVQVTRIEQARKAIKDDGMFIKDRFGQPKEHPAAQTERASMNLLRLLLRELGVSDGDDEVARITRNGR